MPGRGSGEICTRSREADDVIGTKASVQEGREKGLMAVQCQKREGGKEQQTKKKVTYHVQRLRELRPCVRELQLADVLKVVRDEVVCRLVQRRRSQPVGRRHRQRRGYGFGWKVRRRVAWHRRQRVHVVAIHVGRLCERSAVGHKWRRQRDVGASPGAYGVCRKAMASVQRSTRRLSLKNVNSPSPGIADNTFTGLGYCDEDS